MKLRTVKNLYDALNKKVFCCALQRPTILSRRWRNAWGQYNDRSGIMEFNMRNFKNIEFARSVIYHEMIHQFVNEVLNIQEKDAHGPEFQKAYKFFAPHDIELGDEL